MPRYLILIAVVVLLMFNCTSKEMEPTLERISYVSELDDKTREYFVYLPKNYNSDDGKEWPVMLFLHGTGERGNGLEDLDYVTIHGPLSEAWTQKRDLPFIIIAPQLHVFDVEKVEGGNEIKNRTPDIIPRRQKDGTPPRREVARLNFEMTGATPTNKMPDDTIFLKYGWNNVENDLIGMLDYVLENYNSDKNRVYLTGISYGGFGTWYLASKHPERFAAISPVVGWLHPSLATPLADANMPIWAFAGGKDKVVELKYFFEGMNLLQKQGNTQTRFTVHEDMGHDAWKRIYAGEDIYNWFLEYSLDGE